MARAAAEREHTWASIKAELRVCFWLLATTLAVMWGEEIVDAFVLGGALDEYGVTPRTTHGLLGIPLHPFLHGGFAHLVSNSIALVMLGTLVLFRETKHFIYVFVASTLLGGLGVWLVGRDATHIGASGVIYGLMGYLMLSGWFERKIGTIVLSLFVGVTYGWALFGMLPSNGHVSWEGHLFGFIAGVVMARVLAKRPARAPMMKARA